MSSEHLRPIERGEGFLRVRLTHGLYSIVDEADLPLIEGFNWGANRQKRGAVYAFRNRRIDGKLTRIYLHREIMCAPHGVLVDHVDHDGLNNRRSNLRLADNAGNSHNSRLSAANTSGIKGVHWITRRRRWGANIRVNGRNIYLGSFLDIEAAARAYADGAASYFGAFACPDRIQAGQGCESLAGRTFRGQA